MKRGRPAKRVMTAWLAVGAVLGALALGLGRVVPGRAGTLSLGILSLGLILASAIYAMRKWTHAVRLGDLYAWALGHMVLGACTLLAVFAHGGTEEIGPRGWVLYGLTVAVVASGLWGLWERGATPKRFARQQRGKASFPSALRRRVELLTHGIAETLARRDRALKEWFDARYAGAVSGAGALPEICDAYPARYQRVASQLHERVAEVVRLRRELARLEPLERAARRWLSVHLPLSLALLIFVAIHLASWLYYG